MGATGDDAGVQSQLSPGEMKRFVERDGGIESGHVPGNNDDQKVVMGFTHPTDAKAERRPAPVGWVQPIETITEPPPPAPRT